MRRSEVFRAASEGAGINFLIALTAGAVGGKLGPYGPSLIQAATSIGLGLYWADKRTPTAIAVASGGLLTASALATWVTARHLAEARIPSASLNDPYRPGYHLHQPFPEEQIK